MRVVVRVDSKGRITIPKALREEAGIRPGDPVAVYLEEGRISIEPLRSAADEYYGAYGVENWPEDLDEFVAEALRKWWLSRGT